MKKIVCLSLVLLMTIGVIGNVYAASICDISANTTTNVFNQKEEFTVEFSVSNIQSERGIIAIGATLSYDKDSLTIEKMEGQNGWDTPSYNEANGELALTRNALTKNNETFLKVTFKVKEGSKQNPTITLNNITIGDGLAPMAVNSVTKKITVKSGQADTNTTPTPTPTPTPDVNPDTNTKPSVTPTQDSGIKNEKFPNTGVNNVALQVCITLAVVTVLALYIKIR